MIMSQFKYDLAVAYRIYPKASANRPPIFAEDKLKLAEFCLQSFKNSLGGLRVKLWVLLNDCPPEFEAIFTTRFAREDLVLMRYPGVGPATTLHEQFRILVEQTDAEFVGFSEDDYFYLPGQLEVGVNFLKQNHDADFVSPYESHDFYVIDLHDMAFETREFAGKKWSSCISATHTFLARRATLVECRGVFERLFVAFQAGIIPDLAMWMALTKRRVFNPVKFLRWSLTHRWFWAGSIGLSWYYCWRQVLFGRRYKLWSPHPCLANHMVAGLEAPGVDWQKEFQKQMAGTSAEDVKTDSHPLN
jgi:hypothetical protein